MASIPPCVCPTPKPAQLARTLSRAGDMLLTIFHRESVECGGLFLWSVCTRKIVVQCLCQCLSVIVF